MKKILLVSPLPPPVGGIATWTKHILGFFENNTECELLHFNTAIKNRRITQNSNIERLILGMVEMYRMIPLINKCVIKNKPDAVHITSSASFGLFRDILLLHELKHTHIKTVIHFRFGRIPELKVKKNWEWRLLCLIVNKADRVIVIDNNSFETLIKQGYTNIEYLPNPISKSIEIQERFEPIEFLKRKKGNVLFVGHVTQMKGVIELVTACADIELVQNLTLIGPYEKEIEQQLRNIAIKREDGHWLKFEGNQDIDFILENMKRCNLFVLPSYTEGFPNVILESMVTGCPIIATSVGAIEDMLSINDYEPTGICIKPQNIDELKTTIWDMLTNPILAEQLGLRAKERVLKEYTSETIFNKLITIWLSL